MLPFCKNVHKNAIVKMYVLISTDNYFHLLNVFIQVYKGSIIVNFKI